jgi:acetyl esterase/lipase
MFDLATGANKWPAQLDDAQRAVRWVRAHAAEYNVDPDRICALGHSSGGQLAELLGTMDTRDDSDPDLAAYSSRVNCVVGLAGDADLTVPYDQQEFMDINVGLLGGTLAEHPELYRAASPVFHVDSKTVPMLIIHGSADEYTPVEQARHMVDAMHEAGAEVVYAEFPGQTHMGILSLEQTGKLIDAFFTYELHPER